MEIILDDEVNFRMCNDDLYKTAMQFEDKNNRLIEHVHKNGAVNEFLRKRLKSVALGPYIMYCSLTPQDAALGDLGSNSGSR